MANSQNLYAALLAALNIAPLAVRQAQQSGAPNDQKHARVADFLFSFAQLALPVGAALVEARNPAFAPLIDAGVKAAVEATKADGTLNVPISAPPVLPEATTPPAQVMDPNATNAAPIVGNTQP